MPGAISVQEAVRLAKEALSEAPPQELAAWIATNLGLTVKPVIVTVMLGSFQEKEHLERSRQKAMELIEKAKVEEAGETRARGRKKAKPMAEAENPPGA